MGQKKQKDSRYQRLLKAHPACCFCGGGTASTTVDHVPPQACFPPGFFPEGFEFPACTSCNGQSKKDDQIFAYYAQLGDPNLATKDVRSILRLQNGIRNNYKEALPNLRLTTEAKRDALLKMGIQPPSDDALDQVPIVGTSEDFRNAATTIGRKLACALYYKLTHAILSDDILSGLCLFICQIRMPTYSRSILRNSFPMNTLAVVRTSRSMPTASS
ncbi:MAG: hypothetical protein NVV83_00210 [Afipia sp.]|nr:hypothetical protein [Afipia sp.]